MKLSVLFIALIGATMAMTSCKKIDPSGDVTSEVRNVSNFDELDIQNAIEVDVTFDPTQELVTVEAPENLQQHIQLTVVSNKLKIRIKDNVRIKGNPEIKVHITTANINGASLSGASRLDFNNTLTGTDLALDVSGASIFEGDLAVNDSYIDLSGASKAYLSGTAAITTGDLSGASKLTSYDFATDDLIIDLSGASSAELTINNTLDIDASGASSLDYKGDPVVSHIDISGASTITKH